MVIDQEAMDKAKVLDPAKPPMKSESKQEFPKMVYKHPKNKAKEHKFKIVQDAEEHQAALDSGWQNKPHIQEFEAPIDPDFEDEFDAPVAEAEVPSKPKKASKKDAPVAE